MARLRKNKKEGYLFIRVWRGYRCTTHRLNTDGEERLKKVGVQVGQRVPLHILQELDKHREVYPSCGAFSGQLQFEGDDIQKVMRSPHTKPKCEKKAKAHETAVDPKQLRFEFDPWQLDEAA